MRNDGIGWLALSVALFLISVPAPLFAQSSDIPEDTVSNSSPLVASVASKPLNQHALRSWSTRDGLPHNSVNRIAQSNEGYLWLATWEGPVRYNGREFVVFDNIDITKMPEQGALDLAIDKNTNTVIVGGPRGGWVTFDGNEWQPNNLDSGYVFETVINDLGERWAATANGVFRIAADGSHTHYTTAHGLPADFSFRLYAAPDLGKRQPRLWVGTESGVAYYDGVSDQFIPERSIPNVQIRALRLLSNGMMVIASDDGLFYQNQPDQPFRPWPHPVNGPITSIEEGPEGCLWVGTFEYGLGRVCSDSQDWISVADGLPNSHVLDIFKDRENNMWVSTHGGFAQLRDSLFTSFTPNQGLKGSYVRSINVDDSGLLWVGTNDGVSRRAKRGFEAVEDDPLLKALSVLSIEPVGDDIVYVGTYTEGVLQLTNDQVTAQLGRQQGLTHSEVRVVKSIPGTSLLLLGTPNGLILAEGMPGSIRLVKRYTVADGMASDFVTSITIDGDDALWVTSTSSMTYFAPTEQPYSWLPKPVDLAAFTNARNTFAGVFHSGSVWFATDQGLLTRSIETPNWRWLSRRDGLPFDKSFTINFDANDNLWLGGSRGILRIPADDLQAWLRDEVDTVGYQLFTEADGMITRQLTTGGPASVVDRDGHIWFAAALGAVAVDPTQVEDHGVQSPPAVIESVRTDMGTLAAGGELDPNSSRVEFRYVGLGYYMPEHILYQVRLRGFDDNWIDRGRVLNTEYTALPAGEYTFSVRTKYPGGQWSLPTDFHFHKPAYFYQQPWFWFVLVMGVLTITASSVHWRIRALENTRKRLQKMVREQTQELETLALQDALTGLANRRAFDHRLGEEVRRGKRHEASLTIGLLDLDHFKAINDRYLHTGGDQILKQISRVIQATVRDIDVVARWGGEEFAVILPHTNVYEARRILERVRVAVEEAQFEEFGDDAHVTVSIGIAELQRNESAEELLIRADRALYHAKGDGRNCLVIDTAALNS